MEIHKGTTKNLAILGRGPRAFLIGKISNINPEFWEIFRIFKVDNIFQVDIVNELMHLELFNDTSGKHVRAILCIPP